jgi:hypothetical protein
MSQSMLTLDVPLKVASRFLRRSKTLPSEYDKPQDRLDSSRCYISGEIEQVLPTAQQSFPGIFPVLSDLIFCSFFQQLLVIFSLLRDSNNPTVENIQYKNSLSHLIHN